MKISKNTKPTNRVLATSATTSKYASTEKYIRCAIDCLGSVATSDPKAREAIANLGVVLLDLRN